MKRRILPALFVLMLAVTAGSFVCGRFAVSPQEIVSTLHTWFTGGELDTLQQQSLGILLNLRLPRVLAALVIGGSLAISGCSYQAMFLNPLVSPGILGVLAGASFGAGLGIVFFSSWLLTQVLAFACACAAVVLSLFFAGIMRKSSLLVLILGGMVSTALFTSLISILKFIADPNRKLPELVYWLMGTFSRIDADTLLYLGLPMLAGILFLSCQGKAVNALSMGEEEALSLGVSVKWTRFVIIGTATCISALTVVLVGVVGWVGLVIPHIMRFLIGPDHRLLLPASAMGGAMFMVITDTLTRNVFSAELPVGVFTSLISLPIFIFSLRCSKGAWR